MLDINIHKMRKLIEKGYNALAIADIMIISSPTVAKYARLHGMHAQLAANGEKGRKINITNEALKECLDKGMSTQKIADKYKCTSNTIRNYIKKIPKD